MLTLVIETATAVCSVALIDGGTIVESIGGRVGRGHAEQLLPMIAGLTGGGRATRIAVDVGPGSFTGIRVGVAAARALGFAWGVPVAGYSLLALHAAGDIARTGDAGETLVALEGGHGQAFVGCYGGAPMVEIEGPRAVTYAELKLLRHGRAIGDAAYRLPEEDKTSPLRAPHDVESSWFAMLPPALTGLPLTPLYLRPPDAKPVVR